MSYHKYRRSGPHPATGPVFVCVGASQTCFSEPRSDRACFPDTTAPPTPSLLHLRIVKWKPDHATPELGVNGRLCPLTVRSFSLREQVHPGWGWCVQGRGVGSGLWSVKQLQCFQRNKSRLRHQYGSIRKTGDLLQSFTLDLICNFKMGCFGYSH